MTRDERVLACGDANKGQLGIAVDTGFDSRVLTLTEVKQFSQKKIQEIACGKTFTLFLVDSKVYATGSNESG